MARAVVDNFLEFETQIRDYANRLLPEQANLFKQNLALDILRGVVDMSPVRTGRFRGNWQVSLHIPTGQEKDLAYGVVARVDTALRDGEAIIHTAQHGNDIWLSNNVPYAWRLEHGWSRQAPRGMVAITLARVTSVLPS